jgi:GTP-sensing pleiotropic transcriptional regulator CodY
MATTQDTPVETTEKQRVEDGHPQHAGPRQQERGSTDQQVLNPADTQANAPEDQEKTREEEEVAGRTAQRKNRLKRIAPIVLVVAILGALLWWLHARQYEDTDDAQIDGHIGQIGRASAATLPEFTSKITTR